ncbi:hypothetical protein Tco_1523656 [Tanacetum coccineum]
METEDTLSSCSNSEEQAIQQLQMQAKILKQNSMNKFIAFKTATQHLERQINLERQLNKETLHEKDSKSDLSVIKVQFDKFIHSEVLKPSNYNSYDREIQKCKVQKVKATDASSRDTGSSGIVSDKGNDQSLENQNNIFEDESSRSRNECNEKITSWDDTDIRHSYDI